MRHMPVIRLMRDIVSSGRIGEVKAVWCRSFVGDGGDRFFKDWHAERTNLNTLLLQKGAHDIDVIHWLAGGYSRRVSAMGGLTVYDQVTDRADHTGQVVTEWLDRERNWPPLAQRGLNPVIDVEDISTKRWTRASSESRSEPTWSCAPARTAPEVRRHDRPVDLQPIACLTAPHGSSCHRRRRASPRRVRDPGDRSIA